MGEAMPPMLQEKAAESKLALGQLLPSRAACRILGSGGRPAIMMT